MKKFIPISNFHMHTNFSDGKDDPEEYVLSAIKKGFKVIGFSDHVPVSSLSNNWNMSAEKVEPYLAEIKRLKEKYASQIEIYLGFEMDYLPTDDRSVIQGYINQVEYTVGSVHSLYDGKTAKYYDIESSAEEVRKTFEILGEGNNQLCVEKYYRELVRVVKEYQPDIIGHFDIIKKCNYENIFFSQDDLWYRDLVKKSLDEIAKTKSIIEVSTGGKISNGITELYPSAWIVEECYLRNIPITLNSDSHHPDDIDGFFDETVDFLRGIGYTHQCILSHGKWIDVEM